MVVVILQDEHLLTTSVEVLLVDPDDLPILGILVPLLDLHQVEDE